jgi:ADP-ribose pyrophosphatase YjhB (NUDIX family)
MTDTNDRHMIRLDKKPQLFSFRVAALLFQNDHLLVQRGPNDSYWALPGGRAEIGESSEETIVREMREELHRDIRIERLVWSAESFFQYGEYSAHELAFYYLISLAEPFPFHETEIVHRVMDGDEIQFRWVPAHAVAMREHDVRPAFIGENIEALPLAHEHMIVRDGRRQASRRQGDMP